MNIKKGEKGFSALSNKKVFIFSLFLKKNSDFFSIYKKWQQNIIKIKKKCYKEKHVKTIKIFKKIKIFNMLVNDIEIFLKSFNFFWIYKKWL